MAKCIGVMGESGSGKTTAMRNLDPKVTYYIDCDKKGLNWKGWRQQYSEDKKNYWKSDSFSVVSQILDKINEDKALKHIKYIVIDTLNGLMVAEEMRILAMQSGDKRSAWSDLAQNGWSIVNKALAMRDDLTIIILCHSETISDDNGIIRTRIKTNGRKLEKLVLESKMTTVIWAVRQDGKYKFILSADGSTCKVPLGAFEESEIENDITKVIQALEEY
ncbi:MAG: AAA family ATPase [Lachnospiraceae bacterium]|nr:AAA family ATPase [Lachnospiraceae bacterium]